MAPKTTLNAKNLEVLGTQRLAELLIEITGGDAAAKRRLRLELVAAQDPGAIGQQVRKRLATIARSRSFVEWNKMKALADDLDTQRCTIVDRVTKRDADEALELMWRFMELATSIFERCDDSNGVLSDVFYSACVDLGTIASASNTNPEDLVDRAFQALKANDYGQFDGLIPILTPALGQAGLNHLKRKMTALSEEPIQKLPEEDRRVIGWGSNGPLYADDLKQTSRKTTVRMALKEIADAQGDVDGFIDQYDPQTRKVPRIAADIARRLLAAGRVEQAWDTIEATERKQPGWLDAEWEDARIEVLEALGRTDDAQSARWACFERSLSTPHLRDYLKRLPDFDDFAVEQKALNYVQEYVSLLQAVSFLVNWPALDRAAKIIIQRASELDGDHYGILAPAAEALADKHPLAASLLLRSMIDFTMTNGRSSRYRHAARHLMECAGLAATIEDLGTVEGHEAYVKRLRAEHGRKTSFWNLVP